MRFLPRAVWFTAALGLSACGGTPPTEPRSPAEKAVAAEPNAPLPPLTLPAVSPKPDAETTVPVLFAVDRAFVDAAVERWVPKQLHEEKGRDIGHGTKLDLVVTRRKPRYTVTDDALSLKLPLELSIDVKSRLGPIELNLGHCAPTLLAEISFPTRLAPDLSLASPELTLNLQQRCRLSGFDVSELLESELHKVKRRALREIREHLDRSREILTTQARGLEENLDPQDPRCPHLVVQQLVQSPLEEDNEQLATSLGVRGKMAYSCEPVPDAPLSVEQRDQRLLFDVAEPAFFDWSTLLRALDPIISQQGLTRLPLQLRSAKTEAGDRIALGISGVELTGWVFMTTEVKNGALHLVARESDNQALLQRLNVLLDGFSLAVDVKGTEQRARQLLRRSAKLSQVHLSSPERTSQLTLQPDQLRTLVDTRIAPDGVALSIHVRETATKH